MCVRTIAINICCAAALLLIGCNPFHKPVENEARAVHNPVSVQNFKTARQYSSEGRYELAKEHYLIAYAAAGNDAVLRTMLAQELHAVDLMIKTLR